MLPDQAGKFTSPLLRSCADPPSCTATQHSAWQSWCALDGAFASQCSATQVADHKLAQLKRLLEKGQHSECVKESAVALAMLPEEAVIDDHERIGAVQAQCQKVVDYEAIHKESDAAWASLTAQWKAAPAERLKAAEKAAEQARAEAQAPFDQAWAKQIAQWKAATAEKVKAAEKAAEQARAEAQAPFDRAWAKQTQHWNNAATKARMEAKDAATKAAADAK